MECVITRNTKQWILMHSKVDLANNLLCFFTYKIMHPPGRIIRNQLNSISHIQLNYSEQFCSVLSKCTAQGCNIESFGEDCKKVHLEEPLRTLICTF